MPSFDWKNRGTWQRERGGYVFLANAVLEVGKALFRDEWTDIDPVNWRPLQPSKAPPPIENAVEGRAEPGSPAWTMMMRNPVQRRHATRSRSHSMATPFRKPNEGAPSLDDFAKMLAAVPKVSDEDREAAAVRFGAVQRRIAEACSDGRLISATRALAGGRFSPMLREWWNTERTSTRFERCDIDVDEPFEALLTGIVYGGRDDRSRRLIFVERRSLDLLCRSSAVSGSKHGESKATDRIKMAMHALWPTGDLTGIMATDRDNKINDWLKANGFRPISDRSIRRALSGEP